MVWEWDCGRHWFIYLHLVRSRPVWSQSRWSWRQLSLLFMFLHHLHFSTSWIHLLAPAWIPFHLILTSRTLPPSLTLQPLPLHYPSSPQLPIHPLLLLFDMTDCWNWPESLLHCLLSVPYNHNYVAPNSQPLQALITLHCREIISGCDQILKHDGS